MSTYKWKGNVRELRNVIEQMVVLCRDDIITKDMIPEYIISEAEKGTEIDKFKKKKILDYVKCCLTMKNF